VNRWIFLRHGESEANRARVFSGHQDVSLTEHGRTQAKAAGLLLKQMLGNERQLTAWSSDLRRAKETAEIALASGHFDCTLQCDPALRERHLGEWQGCSIDVIKQSGKRERLLTWHGSAPGGESLAQIALRSIALLASIEANGPVLVVAHGGLIRTLLGLLDNSPKTEIGLVVIPNAEPIERSIANGRWTEILGDLKG